MKKIISLLLVIVAVATVLVACNAPATEKEYTLAIGVAVTPNTAAAKVSETVAAIVTDADGKIVLCRFDCIEYAALDRSGAFNATAPTSKAAQGDAYDSYQPMPAGRWYAQVDALASHIKGMTQAEVAAIALDGGVVTDAELKAQCSINVTDLLKAVDKAFSSQYTTSFKTAAETLTAGIAATASVKDTATDDAQNATFAVDFAASVLVEGAVVASILDSAEAELKDVTADGAAEISFPGTKREQGTNYDSYKPMAAGTWYVQADAYAKAAIGKTAADIDTLASEGVAGCTIYAGGYKQVVAAAVKAAK
ncbi:MAG: hypothetical protein IKB75_00960 [Clostridia bacterium]|nr:hypothetical protein [Clostridia bacterium]